MHSRICPLLSIAGLVAIAFAAGCAGTPPAATSTASSSSAPAATLAPGAALKPAQAKTAEKTDTRNDGSRYKRTVKDGQNYYCATEEFVGSKVQKQVCLTETQYEAMRENNRQFMHQIQSQPLTQPAPSGTSGR